RPGHAFYILAVSPNSCRLFRGTQFQVEELETEQLLDDLQSGMGGWRERHLNFHRPPRNVPAAARFHGQEDDVKTIDLTAYFRQIVEPLKTTLHNQSAPLLFAGVEELFSLFRDLFGEKGLIAKRIAGNPE